MEMGERLAKEADALFEAKIEQVPRWHKAIEDGGLNGGRRTEVRARDGRRPPGGRPLDRA
jgi:hypothetical protein